MTGFVLNEYQSACRAAHEQAQLLEDLYARLEGAASREGGNGLRPNERAAELRRFRELLHGMLQAENLLPKQPDPEREELLELLAEVKELFSADEHAAVSERLITEEYGLLRLGEQVQEQRPSQAMETELERTRAAIERLKGTDGTVSPE